jgi:hypothetical protein
MTTRITRDSINELSIQPIVSAIPNYKSFFYTFHTAEPIEIGRLQDDYIESIEHIKGGYILLTSDAIRKTPISAYLTSAKRLVDLYLHLMQAVKMLNDASIIHLNICFRNIIIKDGALPLLTGLEDAILCTNKPIKTIWSPIECRALRYIVGNKLASISTSSIQDICGDNKEEQTFLSKYINQPAANIIVSLLKYSSTWNVYSLNEMILSLLNNPIQPDSFLWRWKKLLERGVATDDRGTADYFIDQTKELMYSVDIADLTTATSSSALL